ncbi:hypothetical protein SARC_07071 [Sphaeroforma arctica JP610]|uniref:Opine dehydrogenase domain-containing protein n=1 Tax=Sphaeroforma arctica JP610 TaxID=667725 RepID=A0A0L0FUT5_9EUKA|nr:hypothetical protein SARC_07071 [Sphaeroforma arctica JP610]KNC80572.1 hypothetical protein SARC_07071 [Sphaeroforma arctica JP610]|eukprot:XP_014154474.1 hypothetical protein SARC_07071 [Sphaeroforma arctica JP610]
MVDGLLHYEYTIQVARAEQHTEAKHYAISKDVSIVEDADVLIMPLPSFAYWDILKGIKSHLREGQYICVTPGQGGFDWVARDVLGDELFNKLIVFATMPMPFNCRITEFGKHVEVQTLKTHYVVGTTRKDRATDVQKLNEGIFGGQAKVTGNFLSCTLYPINAIIHPQRLYRLCKDWKEGDVLPENPLFYEDMDDESVEYMDIVNKELIEIATALREQGTDTEVPHIFDFLKYIYGDFDSLKHIFAENNAYKGFRCPFKEVEGGYVPDFENRYFTEDIPEGLCIYKGVAEIVGVETPMLDKVFNWASKHMGKEYLVDGKMTGKDVGQSHAPQRFGYRKVQDLTPNL